MITPPAGISKADWMSCPAAARELFLARQLEIEQLFAQLTALATELAGLRERVGRSHPKSSKPPSSEGQVLSRQSAATKVTASGAVHDDN